jgi:osmotically-inducible protein OsmY
MSTFYKRYLGIVLLSFCLEGCVALVGGAAVGTGGAIVVYDHRPVKMVMNDENVSYKIVKALQADEGISEKTHIVVSTYQGSILLAGQAPTQALKDQAETITKSVGGFKRLYNEIEVVAPDSVITRTGDTWITAKVKSQLLLEKGLESGQFKAVTEDGVVYLMGVASRSQAALAVDVVRQIDGVKKVVTMFEYQYNSSVEDQVHESAEDPEK